MSARRCHCGSVMIPLFQSFACKAECDLPLSMRTKPKAVVMLEPEWPEPLLGRRPVVGWTPQVGAWVVTMSQAGATLGSIPFRVDSLHGQNAQLSTAGGSYRTVWPIAALARWVPATGDRVLYWGAPAVVVSAVHAPTIEIRMTSAAAQHLCVGLDGLAPQP